MKPGGTIKPGGKAYRAALRARLADLGFADARLAAAVAADLVQRCGLRPRRAWRLARELSLTAAATRFNEVQGRPGAPMRASRIWDFEQWPARGTRPTPATLSILAEVLGTTWDQLVDVADLTAMSAPDRAAFHAAALHAVPVPGGGRARAGRRARGSRLADLLGVPGDEAARLLDELIDAALVRALPGAGPGDADGHELPGLLRDFARECLLASEIADAAAGLAAGPAGTRLISVG